MVLNLNVTQRQMICETPSVLIFPLGLFLYCRYAGAQQMHPGAQQMHPGAQQMHPQMAQAVGPGGGLTIG